jgi:hypothetical protein
MTPWQEHIGVGTSGPYITRAARPTQTAANPGKRPRVNTDHAWEQGILTEERPGGHRVPIMDDNMQTIPLKKYHENKRKYDDMIKTQLHT